jgi:hypothetical protein
MSTATEHFDYGVAIVKAAPPVFVSASSIFGLVHWSDVAYVLTAIYTFLMITQHIWEKWVKPWRNKDK